MKNKQAILLVLLLIVVSFIAITVFQRSGPKSELLQQRPEQLPKQKPELLTEGSKAPDFEVFDTLTGKKLSLSDVKGKVIFFNLWATWCPPCKDEMPSIEALFRELSPRNDFVMVTVLYNDTPAKGLDFLKANGYTFPVYQDKNASAARSFEATGVPETTIIDKKGIVRKRVIGPAEWNSPEVKGLIYSYLKE